MLRFDNLGLGDSEGDWGDESFSRKVEDTAQAVRFMEDAGRPVRLIEAEGEALLHAGGRALTLRRHFIEDVRATDLRERIRTLRRALLVNSPTDNSVGVRNASQIFQTARHPRSFVALEGADHLLTGRGQAARAARIISAWADPYLT